MIDYTLILTNNYEDKQWAIAENDYSSLQWFSETPKPTQDELDALWDATQTQVESAKQAKINTKQSALNKLSALGLTEAEIKELVG
jgi:RNAse (barnase) inhibitor barstar